MCWELFGGGGTKGGTPANGATKANPLGGNAGVGAAGKLFDGDTGAEVKSDGAGFGGMVGDTGVSVDGTTKKKKRLGVPGLGL